MGSFIVKNVSKSKNPKNLLEWVSSSATTNNLDEWADNCYRGLESMKLPASDILNKFNTSIETIKSAPMKEFLDLSERLQSLEDLLLELNKVKTDQADLCTYFNSNKEKLSKVNDPSILLTVCSSHNKQLNIMLNNFHAIQSIKKKCEFAKDELSTNLHFRMQWITRTQSQIAEMGETISMV